MLEYNMQWYRSCPRRLRAGLSPKLSKSLHERHSCEQSHGRAEEGSADRHRAATVSGRTVASASASLSVLGEILESSKCTFTSLGGIDGKDHAR